MCIRDSVYKKHQKQDQKNEGGVLNKEMPISISNLMLLDKKSNKPTRVSYKILKDKKKVRISKSYRNINIAILMVNIKNTVFYLNIDKKYHYFPYYLVKFILRT